ncbi:hypothetical protein JAAARDRAFT_131820 [Jaapia argillacea MUCL 33604]|uniref:BTB domain-containing protein n=1 Tax=Jaapia argillacea MUCL 33604 TaxID=933084 RepID=A0A067PP91_9AGAM|nr:hypothetical protein JAAARDRAFT_131820 [Jaapia argillacea MUCL 33604]
MIAEGTAPIVSSSNPIPFRRSDIWYEDGSVILVAEATGFKVYKGVLAANSEVFRDMFDLSVPSTGGSVDGCPIVLLSDDALDVKHLLNALLDREFFRPMENPQPFAVAASLLRLGKKYAIRRVYDEALSCLTHEFPSTLEGWERAESTDYSRLQYYVGLEIDVINVVREINLPSLLPILFYLCAASYDSPTQIFRGVERGDGSVAILSRADQEILLTGRHLMVIEAHDLFWVQLSSLFNCNSAPCGQRKALVHRECFRPPGTLRALCGWSEDWYPGLCDPCRLNGPHAHSVYRKYLWESLPSFFELPEWDTLRAQDHTL